MTGHLEPSTALSSHHEPPFFDSVAVWTAKTVLQSGTPQPTSIALQQHLAIAPMSPDKIFLQSPSNWNIHTAIHPLIFLIFSPCCLLYSSINGFPRRAVNYGKEYPYDHYAHYYLYLGHYWYHVFAAKSMLSDYISNRVKL